MKRILILSAVLLNVIAIASAADPSPVTPMIGNLRVERVLFLGNSITFHGPAPSIGWSGNWGMAASEKEKDFVHLVAADLVKASGVTPETKPGAAADVEQDDSPSSFRLNQVMEVKVRNIADFERGFATFDVAKEFAAELRFRPSIVIVAIGENVPELTSDEAQAHYAKAFAKLLSELDGANHPAIFVRSCFWQNPTKDEIMRKAAADAKVTFVDISTLGADPTNSARSERQIDHAGVAGHPGDKGMRAIADAIVAAIKKRAKS